MERLTFREFQGKQYQWLLDRNLDTTIQTQSEKLLEEMPEAQEALAILQSDYTTEHEKAFAGELIDIMIVSIGLCAEMGLDVETMMQEKFAINCQKYNLGLVLGLQAQGMTPVESMREAKRQWNNPINFEI